MLVGRAVGALSLLLAFAGGAQAAVLFNNLPPNATVSGPDPIAGDGPQQFDSFTADASGQVDTIQLLLNATGESGGSVDVAIYSDSGSNTPGFVFRDIGVVHDADLIGSPAVFPFDNLGITGLTDGDRYWIVLTDLLTGGGPSDMEWSLATDDSGIGGVNNEFNGASAFDVSPNTEFAPYMMCVSNNATGGGCASVAPPVPEPEPATLGILGASLAALGLLRRRRSA
jgi:hypothetical protein